MYTLILVDYNSVDATIAYIEKCRNALGANGSSHVVIVENGSHQDAFDRLVQFYGSCEQLSFENISQPIYRFIKEDQTIIYCYSGGNIGYAKGNNMGAQIAQQIWADPYYIISNNDLIFEEEFDLNIAHKHFTDDPQIGVIGPQVTTPTGISQSPHKWISAFRRLVVFTWLCAINGIISSKKYYQLKKRFCEDLCVNAPTGPCGWVSGCFMIVRADAFHKVDMFDPHTFLYAEEPILGRRMEQAGYTVWFCRELSIIHNHAQTTKNALSRLKMMDLDFNAMHYYYKTYTQTPRIVLLLAKCNFALYECIHPLWNTIKSLRSK